MGGKGERWEVRRRMGGKGRVMDGDKERWGRKKAHEKQREREREGWTEGGRELRGGKELRRERRSMEMEQEGGRVVRAGL